MLLLYVVHLATSDVTSDMTSDMTSESVQTSPPGSSLPVANTWITLDLWRTSVFVSFDNAFFDDSDANTPTKMAIVASPSSDIKAAATTASSVFLGGDNTDHTGCVPGDRGCIADLIEVKLREAVCGLHQHWTVGEFRDLKPGDEGYQIGVGLHGTLEEHAVDTIGALNDLARRGWRIPTPDPEHRPFNDLLAARASPRFLILGDSHAAVWTMFRHCSGVADDATVSSVASSVVIHHVCSRWGATMLGLSNSNPRVLEGTAVPSARTVFEKCILRHSRDSSGGVILNIGGVDAAVAVSKRAARNGETITDGALLAVSRFSDYVAEDVRPRFPPEAGDGDECAMRPRIYVVPVFVVRQESSASGEGPWEDKVAVARIMNSRLREMAGEQGWIVLEHPFAPGAGGDDEEGSAIAPPQALLGDDNLHFKWPLLWSWLNQALKDAIEKNSQTCTTV